MNNILLGGLVSHTERTRMHAMSSILGTGPRNGGNGNRNGGGSSNGGGGSSGVAGGSSGGIVDQFKENVGKKAHQVLGVALDSEKAFKKSVKPGVEKFGKLEKNMKIFGTGAVNMPGIQLYPQVEMGAKAVQTLGKTMGQGSEMGSAFIGKAVAGAEVGHKAAGKMANIGQR